MSSEKITKENLYIHYNSLISISTISEEYSNKYSNYLIQHLLEQWNNTPEGKETLVTLSKTEATWKFYSNKKHLYSK